MQGYKDKILSPDKLAEWRETLKKSGKTLATLNGSFDLLHAGHLHIIYEASKAADCLLVALNSDSSIRAYKSPDRPIIPLPHRMEMMAALGFVSAVTWFEETTPCELLKVVRPDVHVNGSDWEGKSPEEAVIKSYGGKLLYVPREAGLSTTQIVNKVLSAYDKPK